MVLFINAVISKDIFWYFFAGAKGLYAFMFFIVYFFFFRKEEVIADSYEK